MRSSWNRDPNALQESPFRSKSRRSLWRFALVALAGAALITPLLARGKEGRRATAGDVASSIRTKRNGQITIVRGRSVLLRFRLSETAPASVLRAVQNKVPGRRVERRGSSRVVRVANLPRLTHRVQAVIAKGGGRVAVPERPLSANTWLPIVKQRLRNNCETAALAMLLWAAGAKADQLELQRQLTRSGPLDPKTTGSLPVWGDPSAGFVGRADGGGTSGGFGVYERPIIALARRHGVALINIGHGSVSRLYARLLAGHPIIAWVGLSDGPFKTWLTPAGRKITGNFGEHTVVLTGVRGHQVFLNDPLSGTRRAWPRSYFEQLWLRLGRRAVSL